MQPINGGLRMPCNTADGEIIMQHSQTQLSSGGYKAASRQRALDLFFTPHHTAKNNRESGHDPASAVHICFQVHTSALRDCCQHNVRDRKSCHLQSTVFESHEPDAAQVQQSSTIRCKVHQHVSVNASLMACCCACVSSE